MKPILSEKFDVLIPLGIGSGWDDNELRYSLRSISKNLKGVNNIYIIGNKPDWLTNVIHVPFPDPFPNKAKLRNQNILQKILHTINNYDVTNDFLFTNDDIFINQPINAEYIYNYTDKTIQDYIHDNPFMNGIYRAAVIRTLAYLQFNNLPTKHYDIHTPIIYNKFRFNEIFKNLKEEIIIKSLYANSITPYQTDNKIFKPLSLQEITQQNKGKPFFSISDKALNEDMKTYISETFNKQSIYEQQPIATATTTTDTATTV